MEIHAGQWESHYSHRLTAVPCEAWREGRGGFAPGNVSPLKEEGQIGTGSREGGVREWEGWGREDWQVAAGSPHVGPQRLQRAINQVSLLARAQLPRADWMWRHSSPKTETFESVS